MDCMKVGYFPDWENEYPVILFSGSQCMIEKLAEVLRQLAAGTVKSIRFEQLDWIEPYHDLEIEARVSAENPGLRKAQGRQSFEWILPTEVWEEFAVLASVFLDGKVGHHYLDANDFEIETEITVILSANEYNDPFWARHEEIR